jgi:ribokinase
MTAPRLVFIGGPSLDTLIVDGVGHQAPGGAGFISALAARASGVEVGLVARVPRALPITVANGFGPGGLNRSGLRTVDAPLPRFRISYDADQKANYTQVESGAESSLCAADFPETWLHQVEWVHLSAIGGDATLQLDFAQALRERGYRGRLSAGTFPCMVESQASQTRALLRQTDLFFLNRSEFNALFPKGCPTGHTGTICVTDGSRGVAVIGGPYAGEHPAPTVDVVDPTGAGDGFCGGFLAGLLSNVDPVQSGLAMASTVLGGWGATPLLNLVRSKLRERADEHPAQITALAARLRQVAATSSLHFSDPPHLPTKHPFALPMLWIATMHQFGFWLDDDSGWVAPMYGVIDGQRYKGSDFIWAAFARAARDDPTVFAPNRMAKEPGLFQQICTADDGRCPIPQLRSHATLNQAHGHAMLRLGTDYSGLLSHANDTETPAATLLQTLRQQPGFMGDPLLKKAHLLMIILAHRPEEFLQLRDPETIDAIVDYHMMRACLRTGCVTVADPDLERRLIAREWVDAPEELAIRQATGRAIAALAQQSGSSIAAIDGFFFVNGRKRCLETSTPECDACPVSEVCMQRTPLFQPVFRTMDY